MVILYFDLPHAIKEHDRIIDISGGAKGILNLGLLESVLVLVKNNDYYPDICEKLTHLVFSIAMNHAFKDGNKRSSIALGAYFLEINGYGSKNWRFIFEMENIVLWVAQKKISKDFLLEINKSLLEEGVINESLKIKILGKIK